MTANSSDKLHQYPPQPGGIKYNIPPSPVARTKNFQAALKINLTKYVLILFKVELHFIPHFDGI